MHLVYRKQSGRRLDEFSTHPRNHKKEKNCGEIKRRAFSSTRRFGRSFSEKRRSTNTARGHMCEIAMDSHAICKQMATCLSIPIPISSQESTFQLGADAEERSIIQAEIV